MQRRTTNISSRLASNLYSSGTDSKLVDIAIEFVRKRYHEVRDRRFLCRLNVAITLHLTRGAPGQERRQIQSGVRIAFAHAAAVENERMIQQRSVSVWRGLQALQELRKQGHVVRIHFN